MQPEWQEAQRRSRDVGGLLQKRSRGWGADLKHCLIHVATSTATFTAVLSGAQYAGWRWGVSCATPLLGTACGAIGVGAASVCAGCASLATQRYLEMSSRLRGDDLWMCVEGVAAAPRAIDVLIYLTVGLLLYKRTSQFRNVMPSSLLCPGAYASKSIAAGPRYATENERKAIRALFNKHGCHHCGTKTAEVIADHQPPTATLEPNLRLLQIADGVGFGRYMRKFLGWANVRMDPPVQRFFPQCRDCSQRQSAAVRTRPRGGASHTRSRGNALVMHVAAVRLHHFAGAFVGVHHYLPIDCMSALGQ
eukprot:evm.model.scf_52.19 EVM.evm.TU.scf_52.19   scf_52:158468-162541(+)